MQLYVSQKPERIVCGTNSERAQEVLEEIYERIGSHLVMTGLNAAEIIKHAANSFLSIKISFINMVADLCEAVGADVTQVGKAIGMDPESSLSRFCNNGHKHQTLRSLGRSLCGASNAPRSGSSNPGACSKFAGLSGR